VNYLFHLLCAKVNFIAKIVTNSHQFNVNSLQIFLQISTAREE